MSDELRCTVCGLPADHERHDKMRVVGTGWRYHPATLPGALVKALEGLVATVTPLLIESQQAEATPAWLAAARAVDDAVAALYHERFDK